MNKPIWETKRLEDCVVYLSRGKSPSYVTKSDVYALNQKAIRWGYIDNEELKHHDPSKKISDVHFIQKGDVVINSTGDITIGRAYFFNQVDITLFADSHVSIIRTNPQVLNARYLTYLLSLKAYQTKIYNLVTGATGQLELTKNQLGKLEVDLPPLSVQQRIASILSAYDDLIEVNNQRIKLLEETASQLYKEWFVRMRFPGYKETKFEKRIPEGWEVVKIGKVIKIKNGKETNLIDAGKYKVYGSNGQIGFSNKYNFERVLIIGRVGAYCGSIIIGSDKIWATDNTLVAIPDNERAGFYYSYYLLKILDLGNFSTGSAQPLLTQSIINRHEIMAPSRKLISMFELILNPIFLQIENLQQQNTHLRQIRDRLLPRLISGKLQVKVPQLYSADDTLSMAAEDEKEFK